MILVVMNFQTIYHRDVRKQLIFMVIAWAERKQLCPNMNDKIIRCVENNQMKGNKKNKVYLDLFLFSVSDSYGVVMFEFYT